jgi:hypothetical protein
MRGFILCLWLEYLQSGPKLVAVAVGFENFEFLVWPIMVCSQTL